MLIRFSIENFLSFKERQIFSMLAGKGGRNKAFHVIKKKNTKDVSLLKTAAIFGANASGKSNLIKAIDFGKQLILEGTDTDKPILFQNFRLDEQTRIGSSRIEYEIKHKNKNYAYGIVFTKQEIKEEWLYEIDKRGEKLIFERSESQKFDLSGLMAKNSKKNEQLFLEFIAKSTPNNQLFLTEIRERRVKENVTDIEDLLAVLDWFENVLRIIYPNTKTKGIEFELKQNTELKKIFSDFLNYADTGIDGISLETVDFDKVKLPTELKEIVKNDLLNNKSKLTINNAWVENSAAKLRYIFTKKSNTDVSVQKMMTKHRIIGEKNAMDYFDIADESDGTQRIIDFIPIFIELLTEDKVYIIDEMERSLHPNLMYDLIDIFLKKSIGNNSQLILATHESTLLTQELLRKDEIGFVAKTEFGASKIYSLEEYDIRFDKQIRKDYLLGRYKAIPRLGSRNNLFNWKTNNENA
ncbi:MAG: AAA family ATPase [Chitinophagales bacterium]